MGTKKAKPALRGRKAQQELAAQNMCLIWKIVGQMAKSPRHNHLIRKLGGLDDAVQLGFLALADAARLFDASRGYQFSTYACNVIYYRIAREGQREGVIRLPAKQKKGASEEWNQKSEAAAACIDFSSYFRCRHQSWYDRDLDWPDHRSASVPEDDYELGAQLAKLRPRERQAVEGYYLRGLTLQEVGDETGVCRERVRQLLARGIGELRRFMGVRQVVYLCKECCVNTEKVYYGRCKDCWAAKRKRKRR